MLTIEMCETMQRKIEERMIALFPERIKKSSKPKASLSSKNIKLVSKTEFFEHFPELQRLAVVYCYYSPFHFLSTGFPESS